MSIIGTLLLSPGSTIVACDAGALTVFRCGADDLLLRPIAELIPELPLHEHLPSENIRYANQFGDLLRWRPCRGLAPSGRSVPIDILLSRCGFRPKAALWVLLRRPLDLRERSGRAEPGWPVSCAESRPGDTDAALRVALL